MLAVAYYMAIQGIAWTKVSMMGLTLLLGIVGTMLLFYGMRALIALIVKKGKGISSFMYLPSGRFRRMSFISQTPWPSAPC